MIALPAGMETCTSFSFWRSTSQISGKSFDVYLSLMST